MEELPEQEALDQSLCATNYSSRVLQGFRGLQEEDRLHDFTIVVEGQHFPIHKVLFAAVSDYFRALLSGGMREAKENQVVLHDLPASGVQKMINFVYTGELKVTMEDIQEVIAAATRMQVATAIELCMQFLVDNLSVETAIEFHQLADLYQFQRLLQITRAFVLHNIIKISATPAFLRLSAEQLVPFLRSNSLKCHSEFQLFKCLLAWLQHDPESRYPQAVEVLKHVRFPLMAPEELLGISQEDIMRTSPGCAALYSEAKDYHFFRHIPRKQAQIETEATSVRNKRALIALHQSQGIFVLVKVNKASNWIKLIDIGRKVILYATVTVNNFLYICGGFNEGAGPTNLCFIFDPRFMESKPIATMNECRMSFPLVALGRHLYALGGSRCKIGDTGTSVEVYSIDDDTWSFAPHMPICIEKHAACALDGCIYVSGGEHVLPSARVLSDVLMRYRPESGCWEDLAAMNDAHCKHVMTASEGALYVVDANQMETHKQIEKYSVAVNQWSRVDCAAKILPPMECCTAQLGAWLYFVSHQWGTQLGGKTFRYSLETHEYQLLGAFPGETLKNRLCLAVLALPQHVVPLSRELAVVLKKSTPDKLILDC